MIVVIDNFKTFIAKESNRFKLLTGDEKTEYSADLVKQIIVVKSSGISTGAVKLALENNIDIVYLGKFGEPHGRVYPCKLGGTTLTRRRQLESYYEEKGALLAKAFIAAKMKNQMSLLRSLGKSREMDSLKAESTLIASNIKATDALSGKIDDFRPELLGLEGHSSAIYFGALSRILPFRGRDRNSSDPVNIFLNYGYGMLYAEIERACIIAGLDPYLGFLHTDRYGKPSMTLDLIEEFRQPIVDRTIITFFTQRQFEESDLETIGESTHLSESGRKKIIEAILERLSQKIAYNGKQSSFKEIIVEQSRFVSRYLLGRSESYSGFTSRW